MKEITIIAQVPGAPVAAGPYAPVVKIGELAFLAGQVGLVPETGKLIDESVEKQTERVFDNIEAVLKHIGLSLSRVVKTTVFMTDLKEFQVMNKIFERRFAGHKPARSTVQVAALPVGAKVEIECIASS